MSNGATLAVDRAHVARVAADWRNGAGYPPATASLLAFAWEFCRRNGDYLAQWSALAPTTLSAEFGLFEAWDPRRNDAPPADAWHDGWDPNAPLLRALMAVDGSGAGGRARVLAELRREARACELARLAERLGPLRIGDPARLVTQLRAWDGHRAGATDSALAECLFHEFECRGYGYSPGRARARHARREAQRFIDGRRYRLLAFASRN